MPTPSHLVARVRHIATIFHKTGETIISAATLPALYRRVATQWVTKYVEDTPPANQDAVREALRDEQWEAAVTHYFDANDREGMEIETQGVGPRRGTKK